MPIDPQEDPPITPGKPSEPPQESPPGNPRPEVPPPMQEPGEPPMPDELPGYIPEELPVRGPQAPPSPATDAVIGDMPSPAPDLNPGMLNMPQGKMQNFDLKRSSECAMNEAAPGLSAFRNKYAAAFAGRHNPA
jgi:hypothetical protein